MRKAFENNVPRRRPHLRRTAAIEGLSPSVPGATQPPQAAGEAASRRERREKIKRKVAQVATPAPRVELEKIRRRLVQTSLPVGPLRAVPAGAPDNVFSLVEALGVELARAHQREEALRGELHVARGELTRSAGEGRGATERLTAAYADYLLQVAVRQHTQLAQASSDGLPAAAVPSGVSSGTPKHEAKRPEFACTLVQGAREEVEASAPPPRQLSDPRPCCTAEVPALANGGRLKAI